MSQEHPFAGYVRIPGKAKGLAEVEHLATDLWRARPADWHPSR